MLNSENSESMKAGRRGIPTPGENGSSSAPSADGAQLAPDRECDHRLKQLLRRLPNAPLSSNFTARVLSEAAQVARTRELHPWQARWKSFEGALGSLGWAPRLATGAAGLAALFLCFAEYRASAREELARSVVAVSNVAALPSLDVLVDFEAIQRLPEIPKDHAVDVELLAALR